MAMIVRNRIITISILIIFTHLLIWHVLVKICKLKNYETSVFGGGYYFLLVLADFF